MSLEQTSETVSAKRQIVQIITQWVPGSWTSNSKCPTPIRAKAVSRYNQVMAPSRTKMLSTGHIRDLLQLLYPAVRHSSSRCLLFQMFLVASSSLYSLAVPLLCLFGNVDITSLQRVSKQFVLLRKNRLYDVLWRNVPKFSSFSNTANSVRDRGCQLQIQRILLETVAANWRCGC